MLYTARKRSLGQDNIFTPVCHSVPGGSGPGGGVWSRRVWSGGSAAGILLECILVVHLFEHSRSFRAQRTGLVWIKLHRISNPPGRSGGVGRGLCCVHFSLRISLSTDILIFCYHATTIFINQNHICFLFFSRFSTILWTAVVLTVIFPSITPFSHLIVRSAECKISWM